jgi:hypothetical protein
MILTAKKRSKSRETCSNDTLSTINSTWNDPSLNPAICSEMAVHNDLDLKTATLPYYSCESRAPWRAGLPFVRVSCIKLS